MMMQEMMLHNRNSFYWRHNK